MDFSAPIYFVGDPHGFTHQIAREIAACKPLPAAVVFLGDFDLERTFHREVKPLTDAGVEAWWIYGNHDTDHELYYFRLFDNNRLKEFNLHGRVTTIAGLRIAGLGGIFRSRVWSPDPEARKSRQTCRWQSRRAWLKDNPTSQRWRGGLPIDFRDAIWPEDFEQLETQHADVLVCHEAPSCHEYGHSVIDALAQAMGVSVIVHGHHHIDYDSTICDGGIRVLGVGLAGVRQLDGTLVRRGARSVIDCMPWKPVVIRDRK